MEQGNSAEYQKKIVYRRMGLGLFIGALLAIWHFASLVPLGLIREPIRVIVGAAGVSAITLVGMQAGYNYARRELGNAPKLLPWKRPPASILG